MRVARPARWALLLVAVAACLGDPVGPGTLVVAVDGAGPDTVWLGAPGEPVPSGVRLRITDDAGRPLPGASLTWEAAGRDARVLSPAAESNSAGLATAGWQLGTDAAEEQRLHILVRTPRHHREVVIRARAVPHIVSQVRVVIDTPVVVRLGDSLPVVVNAIDPYGNVFPAPDVTRWVTDTAIGAVAGQAFIGGPHRGRTSVVVASHTVAVGFPVHVTQYVAAIVPVSDTLRFSALSAQRRVAYVVRDDRGRVVADTTVAIAVADTGVVQLMAEYARAVAPGLTALRLTLGPVATTIVVDVQQRIGSLKLVRDTIRLEALMDTTTVTPIVHDSLGSPIANPVLEYHVSDTRVVKFAAARTLQALSPGSATVTVQDTTTGISASAPVVVKQVIAKIDLTPPEIAFDALGDTLTLGAVGRDRLGSVVADAALELSVRDARVASFQSGAHLRSVALGQTLAIVSDPQTGVVATADVRVGQRVAGLKLSVDSLVFDALGDTVPLGFVARDRLGVVAATATVRFASSDPSIVTVSPAGVVRSLKNGSALVVSQSPDGPTDTAYVTVGQRVTALTLTVDSIAFDALHDTSHVAVVGRDRLGVIVADAAGRTSYFSTDPRVAAASANGAVYSTSNGSTLIIAKSTDGPADSLRVVVEQRVASVSVGRDSVLFGSLNAEQTVSGAPRDRLGFIVASAPVSYIVDDTVVARVDRNGRIRAVSNGSTRMLISADSVTVPIAVRVAQRPVRVAVPTDTIRLTALGDSATITGTALDSLGSAVSGALVDLHVADTAIADQVAFTTIRARSNGTTGATFTVAGVAGRTVVQVRQIATSLSAALTYGQPIVTLPVGEALPLDCRGYDANGFPVPDTPALAGTMVGTVTGGHCNDVRVAHSGVDTLVFASGTAQTRLPVTIAAAPIVAPADGALIEVDSLSAPLGPWAPSLIQGPAGELVVYYTAFTEPDSTGYGRGDLHRLVGLGGNHFRYDGVALRHDDDICSPQGQGIENIAIAPRAEAAGWRMLYAAGSNDCYGWQVFSAVSVDGRVWTKDPGVRLDNGGLQERGQPPWPTGEGMVLDQLPSGEWRMIVGSFERINPPENKWQITEWRSPDQLNWTYVGSILTTRDMPPGWQGSVYSPTIREIAPGLWRMLFTADGRGTSGSRSAIWSAVSIDRSHWQVEREVLGSANTNLFYSTIVGNQVLFIRDDGGDQRLAIATVTMP